MFLGWSRNTREMCHFLHKNSKWVWSGNTTITNRRQPHGTVRKSRSTIMRHQEDKLSKAISSLFLIKMIAILEWTYKGPNVPHRHRILATDSAVVEVQEMFSSHGGHLLMQCFIMEKHTNQINTPWWNKEKGSWLTDSQS